MKTSRRPNSWPALESARLSVMAGRAPGVTITDCQPSVTGMTSDGESGQETGAHDRRFATSRRSDHAQEAGFRQPRDEFGHQALAAEEAGCISGLEGSQAFVRTECEVGRVAVAPEFGLACRKVGATGLQKALDPLDALGDLASRHRQTRVCRCGTVGRLLDAASRSLPSPFARLLVDLQRHPAGQFLEAVDVARRPVSRGVGHADLAHGIAVETAECDLRRVRGSVLSMPWGVGGDGAEPGHHEHAPGGRP